MRERAPVSLLLAALSSVLGWVTLVGMTVWYWRTVVPELYEDESVAPFVATILVGALAYLAVLAGAWLRRRGSRGGLVAMVVGETVLVVIIVATLFTTGVLLLPSLLLATLATALPAR